MWDKGYQLSEAVQKSLRNMSLRHGVVILGSKYQFHWHENELGRGGIAGRQLNGLNAYSREKKDGRVHATYLTKNRMLCPLDK
jgi:hypothetical protein